MAVDAVMDSVSVKTTFKEQLAEKGIIFCSFSEAVREHRISCASIWGKPYNDNYFAALNSAVFSDSSFVYVPKGSALSDGTVYLFSDQCRSDGAV